MLTKIFMRVNGIMGYNMGKGGICTQIEIYTKEIGFQDRKMVAVKYFSIMAMFMKVVSKITKNMVKESIQHLLM